MLMVYGSVEKEVTPSCVIAEHCHLYLVIISMNPILVNKQSHFFQQWLHDEQQDLCSCKDSHAHHLVKLQASHQEVLLAMGELHKKLLQLIY